MFNFERKLTSDCVKLPCDHSFNYEYIYNEFTNQKENPNNKIDKIGKSEIKCPYCRKKYKFYYRIIAILNKKILCIKREKIKYVYSNS